MDLPPQESALHQAEVASDELAASVTFPPGHDIAIGAAVTVQIATAATASFGYPIALFVAFFAAVRDLWWLTGIAAVCGGLVYVLSGRRWLRAYRREPARLGAAESLMWVALAVALAVAGLVLLVSAG